MARGRHTARMHCLRLCFEEEPRKMPGLWRIAVRRGRLLKDRPKGHVPHDVMLKRRGTRKFEQLYRLFCFMFSQVSTELRNN